MVKLVNGNGGNWSTYSIFKLFKSVLKKGKPTLGANDYSCAVSCHGQVFTDTWEKFFSRRFAARDVGLRPSPNHPAASEKKISGTQGKQCSATCRNRPGTISFDDQQAFEISAFISFHVEQFISSTQADKIQFLSAKLTRASLFYFCFFIQ